MFFLITNEGRNALDLAKNIAMQGNFSAVNLVEESIKKVELDESVHSVGIGAWPNMLGEMEFDAAMMQGTRRETGSVGALKHVTHSISVARAVMTKVPHAFLVGEGARLFASEHGFSNHNF